MIDTDASRLGSEAARRLREANCCTIEPGLTDDEFERIEETYGFQFSDDHRALLAAGLPVASPPEEGATWDNPWPDWRNGDPDELRSHLEWPTRGVLTSVPNGYWPPSWGARPDDVEAARSVAEERLAAAPQLVPLYAHRFLPAGRGSHGNPVLSIWGTDIIYYGRDLADYISHEFEDDHDFGENLKPQGPVAFWRDFVR